MRRERARIEERPRRSGRGGMIVAALVLIYLVSLLSYDAAVALAVVLLLYWIMTAGIRWAGRDRR